MSAPEIRFPEFKDDWLPGKGGDAFRNSKTKGEAGLPLWSVTIDRGLVPRDTLERKSDDAADELNLRAQPGDLFYNTMRMWQGAVGRASEECMLSPAYVVLSPKDGAVSEFYDYWFKAPRMLHNLWAYSYGLTNDRLRLYFEDFSRIPMPKPKPEEQERVAGFLRTVDARLDGLRREHALLSEYKTGLMQRIFSQEIRFRADDGSAFPDWRSVPISSLFAWINTNSLSRAWASEASGDVQNIHYGDIHGKLGPSIDQDKAELPYISADAPIKKIKKEEFCKVGDIVVADASEDTADIGKVTEIVACRENSLVAGLHTFLGRPKSEEIAVGYTGYALRSWPMRREIMRIAQGISVLGISKTELGKIPFPLPHKDEQKKIADALGAVDAKIDGVAAQIDKLETFKQGLLQKMFV